MHYINYIQNYLILINLLKKSSNFIYYIRIHINISILIASPFNIILTLSIIFSILKLIWLIIDPF